MPKLCHEHAKDVYYIIYTKKKAMIRLEVPCLEYHGFSSPLQGTFIPYC